MKMAGLLIQTITTMCYLQLGLAQTDCCRSKLVGVDLYSLITSSLPVPVSCVSACAYLREGDTSNHHFCFKQGSQPSQCVEEEDGLTSPAAVAVPTSPISTISTDGWGIKIIARSSQDNEPVPGASATVNLQDNGQTVPVASNVSFESDGTVYVSISANGLYIVEIRAEGFIPDVIEIVVDCNDMVCDNERLVALSPVLGPGETRIIMTWDDEPLDVDIHVMAIHKGSSELCRTWYDGQNDCPAISQDLDNTEGGLNGAETVTLLNNTVNAQYKYLIAVEDYDFEWTGGEAFIKSGTGIMITNGVQTEKKDMDANAIVFPEEFYLFGCLDVQVDGSFNFTAAPAGTFFNGHNDTTWADMGELYCQ